VGRKKARGTADDQSNNLDRTYTFSSEPELTRSYCIWVTQIRTPKRKSRSLSAARRNLIFHAEKKNPREIPLNSPEEAALRPSPAQSHTTRLSKRTDTTPNTNQTTHAHGTFDRTKREREARRGETRTQARQRARAADLSPLWSLARHGTPLLAQSAGRIRGETGRSWGRRQEGKQSSQAR